MIKTVVSSLIF